MPVALTGVRVFIATPGGLEEERRLFRKTLTDFNEDDAHARGVNFMPIGWELTPAGVGRPQERINEEVRTCDYMVLVLWDRWGTAPSTSGPYSSGTEEEYNVARECIASSDFPMRDIVVLFKGVDPKQLSDPGVQLTRVLDFKSRLEREKTLLFSTFDSPAELERHLRRHLLVWTREEYENKAGRQTVPSSSEQTDKTSYDEAELVDRDALLSEAERLTKAGELTRAEGLYAKAVVGRTDLKALTKYVRFLRRTGRLDQAEAISDRLLELSVSLDAKEAQIEALSNRAIIKRKRGHHAEAQQDLFRAIEVAKSLGDPGLADLAFLYDNVGLTMRKSGDLRGALEMHEAALAIRRALDDKRGLAMALNNTGAILRQQGRVSEAEAMHREALDLFRQETYERGEAQARANLGEDLVTLGRASEARAEFEASLALNESLKSPEGVGMNLWQLGRLALAEGDVDAAKRYGLRGLVADDSSGRPEGVAGALHLIGQVAIVEEDWERAQAALTGALEQYSDSEQRLGMAWTAADLARAYAGASDLEQAERAMVRAEETAQGLGHAELEAAIQSARVVVDRSKPA